MWYTTYQLGRTPCITHAAQICVNNIEHLVKIYKMLNDGDVYTQLLNIDFCHNCGKFDTFDTFYLFASFLASPLVCLASPAQNPLLIPIYKFNWKWRCYRVRTAH